MSFSQPWYYGSSPFIKPILLLQLKIPKCLFFHFYLTRIRLLSTNSHFLENPAPKSLLEAAQHKHSLYVLASERLSIWSGWELNALLKGSLAVVTSGGIFCSLAIPTQFKSDCLNSGISWNQIVLLPVRICNSTRADYGPLLTPR